MGSTSQADALKVKVQARALAAQFRRTPCRCGVIPAKGDTCRKCAKKAAK